MPTYATGNQPIQLLPNEPKTIGFDFQFDDQIVDGASLAGPAVVTITNKGVAPGAELTIGAASINGKTVVFLCTSVNAIPGTIYKADCVCPTNVAGHSVQATRDLEIISRG